MHEWIFRHRARLRAILGLAPPPASALPEPVDPTPALRGRRLASRPAGCAGRPAPGEVRRSGGAIVLGPMPRGGR